MSQSQAEAAHPFSFSLELQPRIICILKQYSVACSVIQMQEVWYVKHSRCQW